MDKFKLIGIGVVLGLVYLVLSLYNQFSDREDIDLSVLSGAIHFFQSYSGSLDEISLDSLTSGLNLPSFEDFSSSDLSRILNGTLENISNTEFGEFPELSGFTKEDVGKFLEFMKIAEQLQEEKTEISIEQVIPQQTVPFVGVSDGDTLKVVWHEEVVSVRLIGIDTPEKYSTRYGYAECFGEEASAYLTSLLSGAMAVQIEFDESQGTSDKYGRLLAYVFLNGVNLNQKMIQEGYAWEYTYNLPYRYQESFKKVQRQAELRNVGLWSSATCNGERKQS